MLKLTTDKHEASHGLSATAELLVQVSSGEITKIQCPDTATIYLVIIQIIVSIIHVNNVSSKLLHKFTIQCKNKLSCGRETARHFLSLNILLTHPRSFETTLLSRACLSPY